MLALGGGFPGRVQWGDALKHRRSKAGRFALSGLAIATACLWGLNAHALGLGRLTVQSALGEPLRAEIDVTSLAADEASTLQLRVASPDAYRAAGVDYNSVLPATRVQLMKRPDGRSYLRVTSDRAVLEPFVDVILEMNWASGRLVREYTLLLDPPSTPRNVAAAPPAAAVAPVISAAPTPAPAPGAARGPGASTGRCGSPRARRTPRRAETRSGAGTRGPQGHGGRQRFLPCAPGRHAQRHRAQRAARQRLARPDAGRAVPRQPGRLHGQQHEPAEGR